MYAQGTALVNTRTPRNAPQDQDQGTYSYKSPEQQAIERGEIQRNQLLEDMQNIPTELHQLDADELSRLSNATVQPVPIERHAERLATFAEAYGTDQRISQAFTGEGIKTGRLPARKLVKKQVEPALAGIILATEDVIHVLAAMTEEQKSDVLQWLANDLGYEM